MNCLESDSQIISVPMDCTSGVAPGAAAQVDGDRGLPTAKRVKRRKRRPQTITIIVCLLG